MALACSRLVVIFSPLNSMTTMEWSNLVKWFDFPVNCSFESMFILTSSFLMKSPFSVSDGLTWMKSPLILSKALIQSRNVQRDKPCFFVNLLTDIPLVLYCFTYSRRS